MPVPPDQHLSTPSQGTRAEGFCQSLQLPSLPHAARGRVKLGEGQEGNSHVSTTSVRFTSVRLVSLDRFTDEETEATYSPRATQGVAQRWRQGVQPGARALFFTSCCLLHRRQPGPQRRQGTALTEKLCVLHVSDYFSADDRK